MEGYREALEAAGAKVLDFESFGSYQGDWLALVEFEGKRGFVHGYFGSCSGCDAFESEFGYNAEYCEEHGYYDHSDNCTDCDAKKLEYNAKLVAFGKEYLDEIWDKEKALKESGENLDWDMDAKEMVDWVMARN